MAYIVCTSNLDLVSSLFVPALYSTLKLGLLVYISSLGVGMVVIGERTDVVVTPSAVKLCSFRALDLYMYVCTVYGYSASATSVIMA